MNNQFKPIAILSIVLLCLIFFSACKKDGSVIFDKPDNFTDSNYISLEASLNRAMEIKEQYFKKQLSMNAGRRSDKVIQHYSQIKSDNGLDVMRIVSFSDGGFLILSADRRANSVIAFSETSSFPIDTIPNAVSDWLYDVKLEIEDLRSSDVVYTGQDRHLPFTKKELGHDVEPFSIPPDIPPCQDSIFQIGPFLQTTWNQGAGYNNMMPVMSCTPPELNGRAFVGCTATAMAQIIRYHEYPSTFNYGIMLNTVSDSDTTSSGANAISYLMSAIDSTLASAYTCTGTSSDPSLDDIVNSFKNSFGYASTVYRASFDYQVVKNEIYHSRPVILVGHAEKHTDWFTTIYKNAHTWVADGYMEVYTCPDDAPWPGIMQLFFHMNWGWGTLHDGWYGYAKANPGHGAFEYKYNRKMVVGIRTP